MYNQIRIKTEKEQKTAFCIQYRLYKYIIILFGLTNAPATYQKIINNILQQYLNRFVIVYLNNIIIYSKILKKYISYVFKVLKYLNIKNLYLKSEKCEFY